ncbi:hypothetical protein Vafri_1363 [Volvox africanus]|nr:hypothetical protein Vafri_1363 [Volvox africanus]
MAATAGAAASAGSAFPLPFNSLPEVVEIMPSVSSPSSRWQHKMPACGAAGTDKSSLPLSDLIPFFPSASAASSEAAAAPGQQQHATGVLSCMAETPSCEAVTLATATAAEGSVSLSISKLSMAAPPSHPHPHPQQQQEQHMRSLLGQAATIPLDSSSETTHDEPFPWELRRTVSHAVRFVTARRATTTAADVSLQDPPDLPPPLQPPPQHQQPRMMQQQPSDGAAACSGPRGRPPVVQLGLMAALLLVASAGLLAVVQRAHMLPHPPPLPLLQLLQITQPSGTATAAARVLEEAGDTVTEAATDGGGNFDGRRGEVRLVGHHGGNVADAAKAVAAASSLSLATAAAEAPGQRVMRLLRETSRSVGGKTDGRRPSLPESSKTPALDEGRYQQQKQQNMNQLRLKHEKQKQERKRHTAGGITVLPSEDETALVDRSIVITPSSKGPVTPRSANGPLAYQVSIGGAHAAGEDCRAAWAAGRSTLKCGRHGKRGLDENGNDTSIGFIKGLNSNDSGADVTPHHGPAVSGAVMLQQCLNHRYEGLVAGWEDVGTVRPTVKVLGVWWSSHNTTLPLTVVTQLSANRLHQLRAMCRAYHGPLSAAVYVPIAIQGTGPDDSGGSDDDGKKRGRQHKASRRRKLGATESKGRRRPLSDAGGGDSDGSGAVMPGGDGGGVDRPYLSPLLTGPVASEGFRGLKSVVTAKSKMGIETGIRMGSGKGHHTATSSAATRTSHISGGGRHGHRDLSVAELTILRDTTDLVRAFWLEMERKKWCSLDLMLVYELYTDLRAMKTLYPVNHLRNWARLQARTPLIAMLDVDMLPSRDLLRDMRNKTTAKWYINACAPPGLPANWSVAKPSNGSSATAATAATAAAAATLRQRPLRELERDPQASTEGRATTGSSSRGSSGRSGSNGKIPTVFVLPAFQTANETSSAENIRIADRMANMTKAQLEVAVVLEAALPFHVRNFPAGHGATNYLHWFRTNEAYDITYARKFEPWFMAGRQVVPWHDARLRGYGLNKIIQVAATNATGALFNVHPAAFLIHRPHTRSTARGELNDDASDYRLSFRWRVSVSPVFNHNDTHVRLLRPPVSNRKCNCRRSETHDPMKKS